MSRVFFALFGLAGVAILVWLGMWQLQRLEWKTDLLAQIESRMSQEPVELPSVVTLTHDNYRQVTFEGVLTGSTAHFLTSDRNTGPGYKVIAAAAAPGRRVMIDLGFVPIDQKPQFEQLFGGISIVGNVYFPNEVDPLYTPMPDFAQNIFFARDLELMPEYLDTERVLIVATQVEPDFGTIPQRVAHNLPNDHFGYAITWFLLALAWAGMTVFAYIRMGSSGAKAQEP